MRYLSSISLALIVHVLLSIVVLMALACTATPAAPAPTSSGAFSCMELADKLAAAQTETAAMILTRSWNENASRNHGINHDVWCGDSLCSLAGIRFALEG